MQHLPRWHKPWVVLSRSGFTKDPALREKIFLKGIGAEDASHINGLGGGTSHMSQVVIMEKSADPIHGRGEILRPWLITLNYDNVNIDTVRKTLPW